MDLSCSHNISTLEDRDISTCFTFLNFNAKIPLISLTQIISSIQLLSRVQLFVTPWTAAFQASLSITNCWSLPKPMSIESMMPSNHLILCHPLLLLPSIFPSIRVFSNESALRIRLPKYWSFSFSISPSNEDPRLISFRTDWLDLLAVQRTIKRLLLHHSSKASILWCSAFFIVQFSHPYMTTGKIIALTRWTFVDKVMSFLFNTLSKLVIGEENGNPLQYFCLENPRDWGAWWAAIYGVTQSQTWLKWLSSSKLVITFLPRSKHLLLSCLQSPSEVILEPRKIKSATVSPSICQEVMDQMLWS